MKVSVIISTFNRQDDLLLTLTSFKEKVTSSCELIIFDQSTVYKPEVMKLKIDAVLSGFEFSYYHSKVASVPLAWNTAASLASGDVVLFLDDDINFVTDIVKDHTTYYKENEKITGVAGGYYCSNFTDIWLPSAKNGKASTLAGVNTSLKREFFQKNGAASSFIPPFAGFDWELAECIKLSGGVLVVGDKALVFHRAPANGGCENQGSRNVNWYYGCYHNHILWMLHRKLPHKITKLPRHFYWIIKYCLPKKNIFISRVFFKKAIFSAAADAYSCFRADGHKRKFKSLPDVSYKKII